MLKVKPLENCVLLGYLTSNDKLKNLGFGSSYAWALNLLQYRHS